MRTRDGWDGIFYFVRSSFMNDPFRLCLFFSSVQQNWFHYFYLFRSFSYWTIVLWHWSFNKFTRLVKKTIGKFVYKSVVQKKTIVFLSFGKFVRSVNFFFVISSLYSLSFFKKIDCLKKDNSLNDLSRSSIVRFFLNHAIVHIKIRSFWEISLVYKNNAHLLWEPLLCIQMH